MAARPASGPSALGREMSRRRGRRRWVVLVVVLVILAVLFEGADLVSRHVAQDTIASRAVVATGAASGTASVAGWPFLVDLAGGNVHQVTVDLRSVPIAQFDLSELDVVLTGITIDTHALVSQRALHIKQMSSASVRAVITAAELTSASGYPVTLEPDGTIEVTVDGKTDGAQITVVGGHQLALEHDGAELFHIDLAQVRLIPDCNMNMTVTSQAVTTTCTVAPVPQRILAALSGAASTS